jgi:hypothetical protein
MTERTKTEYNQLFVGFEFPPQSYRLESEMISDYLKAVGETSDIFHIEKLVPPMAVTAFAMAALAEGMTLPSGTIHVSQELEFTNLVKVDDTITCYSKVSRKTDRGGLHIMSTDITVLNQFKEKVLVGKVGFVVPGSSSLGNQ